MAALRTKLIALIAVSALASFAVAMPRSRAARALSTGNDWPTYLHDTWRSAASDGELSPAPANAAHLTNPWTFPTAAPVAASPTVVGGVIYVGSWDGNFYAIDAATGSRKWATPLGQTTPDCAPATGITSTATVENGVVYVGGGDANWYALDAFNGNILWHVFTGDNNGITGGHYNWSSPLIYNGFAYIGVASFCDSPLVQGQLLQVDLTTHQIVHTFNVVPDGQVGGGIWSSPSVDPTTNRVFVTTGNEGPQPGQIYARAIIAFDANDLSVKDFWQVPAGGVVDADWGTSPILFNGAMGNPKIAATNKDGRVYAFDRNKLAAGPTWTQAIAVGGPDPEAGDASASSAAFDGMRLYAAGGNTTINGTPYPGSVRALDPTTGTILWEHAAPGHVLPALAYVNGLIIDGAGATIEVRDAASGNVLYSVVTGGTIFGPASASNGSIFMGSGDGKLYAFRLDPGLDTDGDGVPDVSDNCPAVPNADQANTDAVNAAQHRAGSDHRGDACDDNISGDGYTNEQHISLGKDPAVYCQLMRADVNGDGVVNALDLSIVAKRFLQSFHVVDPPNGLDTGIQRIDQDGDGAVNALDLSIVSKAFLRSASDCP